jgi:hypothetical protein
MGPELGNSSRQYIEGGARTVYGVEENRCEKPVSKLRRLICGARKNRYLSGSGRSVDRDNTEVAPSTENRDIPIDALLPVGTDTGLLELGEIRHDLTLGSLGRANTYKSEVIRAIGMDRFSYSDHEKRTRGLTTTSAMRYAAIIGVNVESLRTRNSEDDGKANCSSLDLSTGDEDFDLVLRHFWKHLDAEKKRKLIQLAAGLADGRDTPTGSKITK